MKKLLVAVSVALCFTSLAFAQFDSTALVYSWKLDESFANPSRVTVDTALDGFQRFDPVFKQFTGVATLGNYGLPSESIVYTERPSEKEFVLINSYFPYMKLYENTGYVNTHKPFTQLSYIKGGTNQSKEEILDAFHTRNITKNLNFGLRYTTIGSLGQYQFQKVKNNSFGLFSSLSGDIYAYNVSVNYNKIIADENGGVTNDSLITDTTFASNKSIPTLFGGTEESTSHLPDVKNQIKNLNVLAVQYLSFRRSNSNDSLNLLPKVHLLYPQLIYIFNLNRTSRLFTDADPSVGIDNGLYSNTYVSDKRTLDSMVYWKLSNSARLQFQGRQNNHYFIDYCYELMDYYLDAKTDVTIKSVTDKVWFITDKYALPGLIRKNQQYNSYASTGFNKIFANRINLNLYARYFLAGYRANDLNLSGNLKLNFGKLSMPVIFTASVENDVKTPDYLYTSYVSNNFIWLNNFSRTTSNHLSTNLTLSSKKFEIQGDYFLLRNMIYFNEEALPAQYHTALSLFVISAAKQFNFWKISSFNKIVYQKSENEKVLGLPDITFSNSTYLKHMFNFRSTGGQLLAILGFDLSYNTRYYADAYMPALNSFYRQHQKQLGNYPYFDAFLNLKLKRFRFFVKAEHVNSGWVDKNYFSVLHYPRNSRELKFGLSWTFYD
jgi:hypothetical protein